MFSCKPLVGKLRKTDLSEFFSQDSKPIDVSSIKISCNLVERLTRYKRKQKGLLFFGTPCMFKISAWSDKDCWICSESKFSLRHPIEHFRRDCAKVQSRFVGSLFNWNACYLEHSRCNDTEFIELNCTEVKLKSKCTPHGIPPVTSGSPRLASNFSCIKCCLFG
jgi:hypothetical protein